MAGSKQPEGDDIITDINVTPLVDIILVLLIIFMLTANLIANPSLEVELPEASTGEPSEPTTLALMLTEEGDLFLNGVLTDEAQLGPYLDGIAAEDPKAQAIVAADKDVSHGQVVRVIDFVRQHGIVKFAINIDPSASEATGDESADLAP